jgi:hypothetical protein
MAEHQQQISSSSKIGKKRLPPYRTDRKVDPRLMSLQCQWQWPIGVCAGHLYLLAIDEDDEICVYQYDTMAQIWVNSIPVEDGTVDKHLEELERSSILNGRMG